MSRFYPKNRAPRLQTRHITNAKGWELIHKELAEMLMMMHYTRSEDQFVRVSYGGNMKQLDKHCRVLINIISRHLEGDDDGS